MSLTAKYSCGLCGLLDEQMEVPSRNRGEGVVEWFERAMEAVRIHHALASPSCKPKSLQNIKIYVGDRPDEGLGYSGETSDG